VTYRGCLPVVPIHQIFEWSKSLKLREFPASAVTPTPAPDPSAAQKQSKHFSESTPELSFHVFIFGSHVTEPHGDVIVTIETRAYDKISWKLTFDDVNLLIRRFTSWRWRCQSDPVPFLALGWHKMLNRVSRVYNCTVNKTHAHMIWMHSASTLPR